MFKTLIFERKNLDNGPIANLDVVRGNITEDLTQKASSSLDCLSIPNKISQNDILRLYDTNGRFNYWGVINSVSENNIRCSQFQSLFDDNLLEVVATSLAQKAIYSDSTVSQLLSALMDLRAHGFISTAFDGSTLTSLMDIDVANTYKGITFSYIDDGTERLPYPTNNVIFNIEQKIYDIFNNYNRIVIPTWTSRDVGILLSESGNPILTEDSRNIAVYRRLGIEDQHINIVVCNPTGIITLGDGTKLDFSEKTLFDTYENISNLSIIKEDEDVNTVHLFRNNGTHRGSYTIDNEGTIQEITNGIPVTNRLGTNKTNYIFSDENTDLDLVRSELPTLQYNHKISFDISFDERNKFNSYILGQPIRFYENKNNRLFNSILTARSYEISENSEEITKATFTLGKVRSSLTAKLLKNNS